MSGPGCRHLEVEPAGAVEILRIRREEVLGALNAEMIDGLAAYAETLAARTEVRALVLTGSGRGFVAGADIAGYRGASQSEFDRFQRRSRRAFDRIAALPQVTVCAVNGFALGGGLELALCCDLILVSETAELGLPEIRLGLLPGGGGTQRLPRLVGPMRAKEMLLTGRRITAAEAVRLGIALEALPAERLQARAMELAEHLARQAPVALREGKQVVDSGLETSLAAGLTLEQRALGALFATEDAREGVAAFLEKRPARFRGR